MSRNSNHVIVEDSGKLYVCKFIESFGPGIIGLSDITGPYTIDTEFGREYRRFLAVGPLQLDFAKETTTTYLIRLLNDCHVRTLDATETEIVLECISGKN
jgi:hypothetical protein